ncbi:MAG TPA: hypothetical protein VG889_02085 [Rhizomicrobium sp.]|nr:hypothetical protein [Rhizomicrobium sp.]
MIAVVLAQCGLWAAAAKSKLLGRAAFAGITAAKGTPVLAVAFVVEVLMLGGALSTWRTAPTLQAIPHRICSVAAKTGH